VLSYLSSSLSNHLLTTAIYTLSLHDALPICRVLDIHQLKQNIIDYSKEIGIDKIGFASADVFSELKERLKRQQALGYQSGFEKRSEEHTSELQSRFDLVCRLLLEKKKKQKIR